MMNADYWEQRTALVRDGAVRVLSLPTPEEVDYWRHQLKSNRRNSQEIELMTWGEHASTLRGRADYGRSDEVAEYLFQFIRTSEGKLLKFGTVAFSKSVDKALAQQVIDIVGTKN
jgi:3-oxoacyl-[acyl-carrier-protein] synthase III